MVLIFSDKLVRNDVTARPTAQGTDGKFMKTFFDDVDLVKQNIVGIADTTKEIGRINQAVRTVPAKYISLLTQNITIIGSSCNHTRKRARTKCKSRTFNSGYQ